MGEIAEMQAEVQRCKAIVTRILQSAGEPRGEAAELSEVGRFIDAIVEEWRRSHGQVTLDYQRTDDDAAIVSDPAIKQAVWNVLDNAAEASPDWVGLTVAREGGAVAVRVTDRGRDLPRHAVAGGQAAAIDQGRRPWRRPVLGFQCGAQTRRPGRGGKPGRVARSSRSPYL